MNATIIPAAELEGLRASERLYIARAQYAEDRLETVEAQARLNAETVAAQQREIARLRAQLAERWRTPGTTPVVLEVPGDTEVLAFARALAEFAKSQRCDMEPRLVNGRPVYTLTRKAPRVLPFRRHNTEPPQPAA